MSGFPTYGPRGMGAFATAPPAWASGLTGPAALGAPAPGMGAPGMGAPGMGAPGMSVHSAPASVSGWHPAPAPAPGFGGPAPGFGGPAPGFGGPAPGFGGPAPGMSVHSAPASVTGWHPHPGPGLPGFVDGPPMYTDPRIEGASAFPILRNMHKRGDADRWSNYTGKHFTTPTPRDERHAILNLRKNISGYAGVPIQNVQARVTPRGEVIGEITRVPSGTGTYSQHITLHNPSNKKSVPGRYHIKTENQTGAPAGLAFIAGNVSRTGVPYLTNMYTVVPTSGTIPPHIPAGSVRARTAVGLAQAATEHAQRFPSWMAASTPGNPFYTPPPPPPPPPPQPSSRWKRGGKRTTIKSRAKAYRSKTLRRIRKNKSVKKI